MSDLIDRAEAQTEIMMSKNVYMLKGEPSISVSDAVQVLRQIPPVTPQQRWIPVSERLPDAMGNYLVTLEYKEHGTGVTTLWFHNKEIGWDLIVADVVVAWMPLPQPYVPEINVGKMAESEAKDADIDCRTIPCAYRRYGPAFLPPDAPQKCVDCLNEMYGVEEGAESEDS